MHHSLKGVLIAFASVGVFWTAQALVSSPTTSPHPAQDLEERAEALQKLGRQVEELAARVAALEYGVQNTAAFGARLARLENAQRSASMPAGGAGQTAAHAAAAPIQRVVDQRSDDDGAPADPADLEAEATAWFADVIDDFAAAFSQESRDPKWSAGIESYIRQTWAELDLAGSNLRSADCRRTICRLEVTHEDEEAGDAFMLSLAEIMPAAGEAVFQELVAGDPSAGMVVYFVGGR